MDFNKLQNLIKIKADPTRWSRGVKYYNRGLVEHVDFTLDNDIATFSGAVESDFFNEIYTTSISIDTQNYKIMSGHCTCDDCRSRSTPTNVFLCKHLVSTSIKGIFMLKRLIGDQVSSSSQNNSPQSMEPLEPHKKLLSYFNNVTKEQVYLDVILHINEDGVKAEFKIGNEKMYVLKNLKDFANCRYNNSSIEYGKHFVYRPQHQYFSPKDEIIADIIEDYGMNSSSYVYDGQYKIMDIKFSGLKKFLKTLKNKNFNLNYFKEQYTPRVIEDKVPIEFDFKKVEDKISLTSQSNLPIPLTNKGDILLYNGDFYLLSEEKGRNYEKLHSILSDNKDIVFDKEDVQDVLLSLLPNLEDISNKVNLDDQIKDNVVKKSDVEFYFDLKKANISCTPNFIYKGDNTDKFLIRDLEKEYLTDDKLQSYNFIKQNSEYIFDGNDLDLFNFLNNDISNLQELGTVYYSDKFKSRKIYKSSSINARIGEGFGGYLEFNFNISDIDKKEYKNIIDAFKSKSTFYKLKDGSFIDLSEQATQEFLELVDNLDLINNPNEYRIHNSKAFYINDVLQECHMDFIGGRDIVSDLASKFKFINEVDLSIPSDLKANLRDYQLNGLQWFKTLNHYEFGGILADEMGLGKTLQTISFLLSQCNKKSLIVTPTSLIYNWKNEFDTFAPSLKVLLIHGNKKEREKSIAEIDDYDIVLTTYATLRNDLDLYGERVFDYCIIDEAQNIKNPMALSTQSVKMVNCKVRFALTGTPIENSLLELWSIFDFVMPGYLYNRHKFQDLFISSETNVLHLKKLIKPFILRRTKKEVMTELPDKIEKKFFVELNKDQQKIYSSYIEEIKERMSNPNLKTDKFTILSYLTKLRQLCLDPSVVLENYNKKSSKTEACLEIIEEAIQNNHKILLFSQFTSVLKNIETEFKKNNISYSYIDGQTNAKDRLALVDEFNKSDEKQVFLISLKAGGTGLNLTSADIVIHFDPWWNPAVEDQASDRAHRFGQKNVVEVIKLIAKGTIEEKIIKLQENKKELIEEMIDGELSNNNVLKSLSDKEILELFS